MDPSQLQNQPTQGVAAEGVSQTPTPMSPSNLPPLPQSPNPAQSAIIAPKSGGKKLLYVILIIFGVLLAAIVAFILILNMYSTPIKQNVIQTQSIPQVTPIITPTPASEEEEISSLNIPDPESELKEVNTDLQQL